MKKSTFSVFTLFILLGLSGCGGSSDTSTPTTEVPTNDTNTTPIIEIPIDNEVINIVTISNIGNSINGLGYYGDNVIFGNTKITQGIWNITEIDSNNQQISYAIKDTQTQWYKNDRITMLLSTGFTDIGYYGVSEDGKVLIENWETVNIQMTYRYLNEMTLNDKKCMKVTIGENLKTYA
ncbi:hypothetical protein JHD49_09870, partial [Sulfurimonas sp. SAG-AH-194-C21]